MFNQKSSGLDLSGNEYELTSLNTIENLTNTHRDRSIPGEIVLKVVNKEVLRHYSLSSRSQYYLSNNAKLYLLEFNLIFHENFYNDTDSKKLFPDELSYYCLKRYDVRKALQLGHVIKFTGLRFIDKKLKSKENDSKDDNELWNNGKFAINQDTDVEIIGTEPFEEYPKKSSKYFPLWRDFSYINKDNEGINYKIFMRVIFITKISESFDPKNQDTLDLARFETFEDQELESSNFKTSSVKVWIGDRKGFKIPLVIEFNRNSKEDCKSLVELDNSQEIIVTCGRVYYSNTFERKGFEVCSPQYIVPVKEPKMIRHDVYLDIFHNKTNPIQIKESEPFKNPGWAVNILGLFLPVPSKPEAVKYGRWANRNLCRCVNTNSWVSLYFKWHSVPLYGNPMATNTGLTHHAITIYVQCLKCNQLWLILTIEKGKSGIQCFPGLYKNFVEFKFHFKKLTFNEILEEVKKHDKPYDLINSNCQHFAASFFDAICQLESKEPRIRLIDLDLIDGKRCECESKDGLEYDNKMWIHVSVSKKNGDFNENNTLYDATYYNSIHWFKCSNCQKHLVHCFEIIPPIICFKSKDYEISEYRVTNFFTETNDTFADAVGGQEKYFKCTKNQKVIKYFV